MKSNFQEIKTFLYILCLLCLIMFSIKTDDILLKSLSNALLVISGLLILRNVTNQKQTNNE